MEQAKTTKEIWQILGIWAVFIVIGFAFLVSYTSYIKTDFENAILQDSIYALQITIDDQQFLLSQYADYRASPKDTVIHVEFYRGIE